MAHVFRNNSLGLPSAFLAQKGLTITSKEYLDGPFIQMAAEVLEQQTKREKMAAKTKSVDELGGIKTLEKETKASLLAAQTRARGLTHFLDELGPPGPIQFDPYHRFLVMRGKRFDAELLGSFAEHT